MGIEQLFAKGAKVQRRARWLAGAVMAASVASAIIFTSELATAAPAAKDADVPVVELMKPGELPDTFLGKKDAPVTIVEYSSMTCSHCADYHRDVFPDLKKKYIDTGKVKYIVREFPFDNVAAAAFMLTRCVDPSKRYDLINVFYKHQNDWAFGDSPIDDLKRFSKQAGFTDESFDKCLNDEKLLKSMQDDRERAYGEFSIHATPTFFVNGKRMKGAHSIEEFDKMIAQAETAK